MDNIWKVVVPLGLLAVMVGYHKVAHRLNVPKPVYWITMMSGGFLVMSIFELW
ncbi:MAG: hypothetical protein ACPIFQ_02195 [Candidatus Puniceispirillaceae bacterium]|jgi:hypothetical protein